MIYLYSLGVLPYVRNCLWSLAECADLKAVPRKRISRREFESVTFESQSSLFSAACEPKQKPKTKLNFKKIPKTNKKP